MLCFDLMFSWLFDLDLVGCKFPVSDPGFWFSSGWGLRGFGGACWFLAWDGWLRLWVCLACLMWVYVVSLGGGLTVDLRVLVICWLFVFRVGLV